MTIVMQVDISNALVSLYVWASLSIVRGRPMHFPPESVLRRSHRRDTACSRAVERTKQLTPPNMPWGSVYREAIIHGSVIIIMLAHKESLESY